VAERAADLRRPLVFVTGKGGTGKTTVAAALAAAAGASVQATADIDPDAALGEWLARHAGAPVAAVLRRSRAFAYLVAAAPGAVELVKLGKLVDLAEQRPLVADGPSTGHALAMLEAPRTFARVAVAGPVKRDAEHVAQRLADPAFTAYVAVTLPEPLAVDELLELDRALPDTVGRGLDLVVVNAVHPDRFSDADAARLQATGCPALAPVLAAHRRARREAEQVRRVRECVRAPVVELGFVYPPVAGARRIQRLARDLRPMVVPSSRRGDQASLTVAYSTRSATSMTASAIREPRR